MDRLALAEIWPAILLELLLYYVVPEGTPQKVLVSFNDS